MIQADSTKLFGVSDLNHYRSLHILPMSACVSSGCSGFFPQSKDVRVRWIGHAKLPLSVRRIRVNAWGWGLGGIVFGVDLMGRMTSFCTVGFYDSGLL